MTGKCLVTGCAGFIGSHLCESLLRDNCVITGIDCFTDYYSQGRKEQNLKNFIGNKRFKLLKREMSTDKLTDAVQDTDYVFHLAAQPGVRNGWGDDFEVYVQRNIIATHRLLKAIREVNSKVKKVILASSSSIYGDNPVPMKEEQLPKPVSPYGITKVACENLGRLYFKQFGLPVVTLRYFTVYGPRQRPDMAFYKFIDKLLNGEPIVVYGDGSQKRDFTYIDDAVESTLKAAEKGIPGDIYNIGGGTEITVRDAVSLLEDIAGREVRIEFCPSQPGEMHETLADNKRARDILGFVPGTDLRAGLKKELEWFLKEQEEEQK